MKKSILSILIIISFLFIQINYNGMKSNSILISLLSILSESINNGWDLSLNNFVMNFTYNLIETICLSIFLLIVSFSKKINLHILAILLYILLWMFWLISYAGMIEIKIYILSSIPFLILSFYTIFYLNGIKKD